MSITYLTTILYADYDEMVRKKSQYHHLKKAWLQRHKKIKEKLISTHKEVVDLLPKDQLIGSLMLASTPFLSVVPSVAAAVQPPSAQETLQAITKDQLITLLSKKLPTDVVPLTPDQENDIEALLSTTYRIKVTPELDGIRLNRSYGLIGKEQHLRRYPGDTIYDHVNENSPTPISDGVAPGLGAWGYFANSKEALTPKDEQREKWYIAVPTFLSPGWDQNVGKYGLFFKYRKMLVVNPENGKGVVADIADAGPAEWTGKHLGGSPEVMNYLERVDGAGRGPVLYFFIEDPNDTIPLGPVNL